MYLEIYPEELLYREAKTMYAMGTVKENPYARENIILSYCMNWLVSESVNYFSSSEINKKRAQAYYYQALCCEKMMQWADNEMWFDLCDRGIECCTDAIALWDGSEVEEESGAYKNAKKLRTNLTERKENREKLNESQERAE